LVRRSRPASHRGRCLRRLLRRLTDRILIFIVDLLLVSRHS